MLFLIHFFLVPRVILVRKLIKFMLKTLNSITSFFSSYTGGPLQIYNSLPCTYTQLGVVSFGSKDCGTVGIPGVYVNVFHYLDWIEEIVWSGNMTSS